MNTWPFPPPTGPVPWTPKEVKAYEKLKRANIPEAPM